MRARPEYRNRQKIEVVILDALVDRAEEGMTVFELRAAVDADIDAIEEALSRLKSDGLISVEQEDERVVIMPDERVIPDPEEEEDGDPGILDKVRERFGL